MDNTESRADVHRFNFILNLLASCLLGVSGLFSVTFASEEKPASWASFFPGQELDDILFGQIGDRSPLISMMGKGYELGTEFEGKLEVDIPLNISKAAAKQMAERLGPKINAKNLRKMVGVELMAEVVIKYRKTTEIMIRSTNPLLGPMSIEKNGTRYLNILPDRDIVIFCRQKTKITNVISGGAELDLVRVAASVEISGLKISEIELYSGTLPVRDNVPIFIYEKLCMEPFEKKAMTIIEEEMKEAVSKFYNFAPDQSACIVPQPEKKIYLNEMGFKSKKEFNKWRKNNDDPGCEYLRHSLDKKMMQYTSGSPIYRCIPTDKNNPSVGKCEYRRTKGQRCNIYRSASGKVSGDPKTGERISVRDLKPCDELNNFKCSVTKNTGFLSVFKGYTGICQ